ncbi:hypothetical protein [Faecalicoccus pleomorphus]|uniref:hypothetical protein n=1 Tax=Faecalicoccus pleomorphus TaxID=1323 RepID=UPI001EF45641|nr:hypothetical protein [Faecalicoccus pleomorphus]
MDDNEIHIGDNALIAPNVQIYTSFHPTSALDHFGEPKEDGSFAFCKTQTAPVHIGDNVVIKASNVVTKDIPENCVACGNPCCVIRENK